MHHLPQTYFLAADLLEVYGEQPFFDFHMPCSRCDSADFVRIDYRSPESGDWGNLDVRRPAGTVTVQKWRTVKLGDEM